jgi:hypothetical protein
MTLNHNIFSLMSFAIGALCFVAFITTLKPEPLYHSETSVGSIYGASQPANQSKVGGISLFKPYSR